MGLLVQNDWMTGVRHLPAKTPRAWPHFLPLLPVVSSPLPQLDLIHPIELCLLCHVPPSATHFSYLWTISVHLPASRILLEPGMVLSSLYSQHPELSSSSPATTLESRAVVQWEGHCPGASTARAKSLLSPETRVLSHC